MGVLFVKGDFEKDFRTHHIHVVKWNNNEWNNYINFRDYLNAFPEKAMIYDDFKRKLAIQFSEERRQYTEGKKQLIDEFLEEARLWRAK
ncbi:MAG: GrpB family protein [Lachnospiraceae bacterium]|nr:GrpB family protein [Lachnospiraceae bacterium]